MAGLWQTIVAVYADKHMGVAAYRTRQALEIHDHVCSRLAARDKLAASAASPEAWEEPQVACPPRASLIEQGANLLLTLACDPQESTGGIAIKREQWL